MYLSQSAYHGIQSKRKKYFMILEKYYYMYHTPLLAKMEIYSSGQITETLWKNQISKV